jgi:hypothetical protein
MYFVSRCNAWAIFLVMYNKPKTHEHIGPTVPLLQEEPEKVFMTLWAPVGKGMEPRKHRQLEA